MKKKKINDNKFLIFPAIIVIMAIYTILSIWFNWFPFQEKFNPATDVCDEWKVSCDSGFKLIGYYITREPEAPNRKCSSWHPKDKCQLNPEAEGCVCDEYDSGNFYDISVCNITIRVKFNIVMNRMTEPIIKCDCGTGICNLRVDQVIDNPKCIRSHLPVQPIKIDLDNEKCVEHTNETFDCQTAQDFCKADEWYCDKYDKYCCLKKSPKTECEKGNPEYIEDEKMPCEHIWNRTGDHIDCSNKCRKKMIGDLSCPEIKENYVDRRNINFNEKELLFEYIDRCGQ